MPRGKGLQTFFLLIVTALFVYGMVRLLTMRFEKGDAYPRYSSYRPDPLGTKAFYEGLGLLPGIETSRNIDPLQRASGLSAATLFLFGLRTSHFSAMQRAPLETIEEAARGGGRIVVSFFPTKSQPAPSEDQEKRDPFFDEQQKKQKNENGEEDEEKDEEEEKRTREGYVNLCREWGVGIDLSAEKDAEASLSGPEKDLPASLPWQSTLFFDLQDIAWRTVYARAGKPVLIERPYGKGSIVLSADSFFLSNEAMKNRRYPELLSWLCGRHRRIVFDETHLGVSKAPGIAALLRKYGLAPFFISLIVLALLAIWKQAARLVPVDEEEERASADPGKDAVTGFTNLLRRNIPPDRILYACLEEWKRSFTHGRQSLSALLPRIQEIIGEDHAKPKKNRNAVQVYREISGLAKRR